MIISIIIAIIITDGIVSIPNLFIITSIITIIITNNIIILLAPAC